MIVKLMDISDVVIHERTTATAIDVPCVVLYKLVVPVGWEDVEDFLGRSASGLSNIFLHLVGVFDGQFDGLLLLNHQIAATNLSEYAQAVFDAGSPLGASLNSQYVSIPRQRYRSRKTIFEPAVRV